MSAANSNPSAEATLVNADLPIKPRTRRARFFEWLRLAVHSKRGVWVVILVLLGAIAVTTYGFEVWDWPSRFIPLYAADAQMAVVASALFVIVVRWDRSPASA